MSKKNNEEKEVLQAATPEEIEAAKPVEEVKEEKVEAKPEPKKGGPCI